MADSSSTLFNRRGSDSDPLLGQNSPTISEFSNSDAPFYFYESDGSSSDAHSALPVSFTHTNSTMSNRAGLGRTLDRSLQKAGVKVVSLISRISEGLGRGPNALMARMLTSGQWGSYPCHSRYCRVYQDHLGPAILWSSPSIEKILDILFSPYCKSCRDHYVASLLRSETFVDGCRKLVQDVQENDNSSVRRLCAHYVGALSYFHVSCRQYLLEMGAQDALRDLRQYGILWRHDFISGPATRALASLTETLLLPVIKSFEDVKRKVDAYYPQPLSQHDLLIMEPQTTERVSQLFSGLSMPDIQIPAAYHLSLALVLSYHGLTHMIAPLASTLNATKIDWLWRQFIASDDPVARAVLGRLLCNLYDFISYAAFSSKWNADIGEPAGIWLWKTLWAPLFSLQFEFALSGSAQRRVVHRVCKVFFRWSRTASSICYEAQHEIHEVVKNSGSTILVPRKRRRVKYSKDPVTSLMRQISSPLFRLAGILEKERRITGSPQLHEIDRAIPHHRLGEISSEVAEMLFRDAETIDDALFLAPVLKSVVPWYDSVCRTEVREAMKGCVSHKDAFVRREGVVAMDLLRIDSKCYEFRCTGITVGVLEEGQPHGLCAFDEHGSLPYRPSQCYRQDYPVRRLVTSSTWRDVRWVPYVDIAGVSPFYTPITITIDGEGYCIGCIRDMPLRSPNLALLSLQHVLSKDGWAHADVDGLHILSAVVMSHAGSCPVFWLTGSKLTHALTGEEFADFESKHKIFRQCLCHRLWLGSEVECTSSQDTLT